MLHGEEGYAAWLADRDSNPDKQNQNLSCYRYTIGQVMGGDFTASGDCQRTL